MEAKQAPEQWLARVATTPAEGLWAARVAAPPMQVARPWLAEESVAIRKPELRALAEHP